MDDDLRQLEAQRRAFEAQFGSLESMGFEDKTKVEPWPASEDEGSSDAESPASDVEPAPDASEDELSDGAPALASQKRAPRVIKFQDSQTVYKPSKKEQRLIRSGKAPKLAEPAAENPSDSDSDSDVEKQNLQNDIELQRFLKESHLISAFQTDKDSLHDSELHGKARARTLEKRLQDLSTVNRVAKTKLERVPMNVRKGMVSKHMDRISRYEKESRDAGTVLSRVSAGEFRKIDSTYKKDIERRIGAEKPKRSKRATRDFGLKIQSVGRNTRHGLKLSAADVQKIKGSKR